MTLCKPRIILIHLDISWYILISCMNLHGNGHKSATRIWAMVIESSLPRLSEFHVGHGTIGIPQLHQEGVGTTPGTDSIEGSNSGGDGPQATHFGMEACNQKFATVAQVANFPDVPRPNSTELIPLKPRRTSCQRHGGQQPPPPTPPQDPVRSNFSERQPGNKIVTQVGEVPWAGWAFKDSNRSLVDETWLLLGWLGPNLGILWNIASTIEPRMLLEHYP